MHGRLALMQNRAITPGLFRFIKRSICLRKRRAPGLTRSLHRDAGAQSGERSQGPPFGKQPFDHFERARWGLAQDDHELLTSIARHAVVTAGRVW